MKKQGIRKTIVSFVLLIALLTVQVMQVAAETDNTDTPSVVCSTFSSLYQALIQANDGDVIGIDDAIIMNTSIEFTLGYEDKHVTLVRMNADAHFEVRADQKSTIQNITFDGNGHKTLTQQQIIINWIMKKLLNHPQHLTQVKQNHQNLVTAVQGMIQGILVIVAKKTLPHHHKQTQVTAVVTRMEQVTRRMMVQEVQNSLQQVQMPPQQTIHPMTAPQQPQTTVPMIQALSQRTILTIVTQTSQLQQTEVRTLIIQGTQQLIIERLNLLTITVLQHTTIIRINSHSHRCSQERQQTLLS